MLVTELPVEEDIKAALGLMGTVDDVRGREGSILMKALNSVIHDQATPKQAMDLFMNLKNE